MKPGHLSTLRRFGTVAAGSRAVALPGFHPAVRGGRTLFASRVFEPGEVRRVLKDGSQNRKIGKTVMKGRLKGQPIYTLTLEERATCPRTCSEWQGCYGNNMQAAERIVHGPELIAALALELAQMAVDHPHGFLVRLHVLGDFWSAGYVRFWRAALAAIPQLSLFGFTAHHPASEIGGEIAETIAEAGWPRCAIRFSGSGGRDGAARVTVAGETDPEAVACPAQSGATDCCATCALCWQSRRSISFRRH